MARVCVAGPDGHWRDQAWAQEEDRLRDCSAQHRRVAAQLHPGKQVAGTGSPRSRAVRALPGWGAEAGPGASAHGLLLQADLREWLCALGLPQYHKQLVSSGYDSMGLVADLTWEELQEIGVNKLGEDCPGASWPGPHMPPRGSKTFQGSSPVGRVGSRRDWGGPLQPQLTLWPLPIPSQVIRRSLCWE